MAVELDHLFIFTSAGAPEVDHFLASGFTEGQSNIHPGQGTACRRVFFHNAYLEFLWVHNEQEAQSEMVKPLRLWERCRYRETGSSRFGLILRPAQQIGEPTAPPFESWAYCPPFFQPLEINVAVNSTNTGEPLLFFMPFGKRPDIYPMERRQPLEHSAGAKEITGLRLTLCSAGAISKPLTVAENLGIVSIAHGAAPLGEVIFDNWKRGQVQDFRPGLPLIFRW
jgi:hypothetical protein